MKEIWKDITGFEGLYQISNLERVKSLSRKSFVGNKNVILKDRYLKYTSKGTSGFVPIYYRVCLYKNGIRYFYYIHRLVAQAFIPNFNNYSEVNHKDGNKKNNCVENLEWCTKSQNKIHAIKNGLCQSTKKHKEAVVKSNILNKSFKVLQYDKEGNFIKEHISTNEAAISVNASQGNVSNCCNNKKGYKTVKGFIFKYKEL